MLTNSVKGVAIALAGATLGTFINFKDAFAAGCYCNWYGGVSNANCPKKGGCPPNGCPSNCSPCTSSDVCNNGVNYCNYPNGHWTSCSGLGTCGNGYRICLDCKCPNCSYVCTCLSTCICCSCCTPLDVENEMRRLAGTGIPALLNA
jgi:hypothetical protein